MNCKIEEIMESTVVASNTHCVVACPGDKTTNHSYLFVSKAKQTKQTNKK